MQAQRRELKIKQHKLLVYLADLYTQHAATGADKAHQAGTATATCQLCHEIKVIHEIIDELSDQLKLTAAPKTRQRRPHKIITSNKQLTVFCLSTKNGANYFVRAVNLAAAMGLLAQLQKKVVAYTTVTPTLYSTINLADQTKLKNLAQFIRNEPDFTGIITIRPLKETPALSY
ncbi:hypothetical protein [Loigolactobacillus binensis]|uniref:Uncharacterized protein n=1 Tax=Loigolactobacillus binensis TaxID=2559922 RepID=A0ABW3E9Y4_9LACO|nr:hypothetical protein [Loigolactobacillus binensis]